MLSGGAVQASHSGSARCGDRDSLDAPGRAHAAAQPRVYEPLTPREREVLERLAAGATNREIARALFRTEHTVKWHLKNIFAKLGVNSRVRAVLRASELRSSAWADRTPGA
jgi:LuxR family maltose regulon positive regulatory protein